MTRAALAALAISVAACAQRARTDPPATRPSFVAIPQVSGTTALLQAVSAVDSEVVWVSGHQGTYARTTDGGATWHAAVVPGADSLQFRDVHAVSADTAYLMSAGNGELSRIYKTTDGGASWQLQFTSHEPKAFYDCMAFWDSNHGIAMSDEVGGHFPIVATADGGQNWKPISPAALPSALPGEGSFAASGSCVAARAPGTAWIGTGNSTTARVLRTTDRGRSWTAVATPLPSAEGVGIASVSFRDDKHGVVMGGSMMDTSSRTDDVAFTSDGGRSWTAVGRAPFPSAIYGGSYVPGARVPTLVAVGPGGAAASLDDGRNWVPVDTAAYWSVGFASPTSGWVVGPRGRIKRLAIITHR
jgi:photosystem II stability/assembly factor-like uncharacterized protein